MRVGDALDRTMELAGEDWREWPTGDDRIYMYGIYWRMCGANLTFSPYRDHEMFMMGWHDGGSDGMMNP